MKLFVVSPQISFEIEFLPSDARLFVLCLFVSLRGVFFCCFHCCLGEFKCVCKINYESKALRTVALVLRAVGKDGGYKNVFFR